MMSNELNRERRYPRIPSTNTVLVREMGESPQEGFGRTRTVSLGGCSFFSDEELAEGSIIEVLISVGASVVRAKARVVYRTARDGDRPEVGVEFLEMNDDDRQIITDLCAR